MPCSVTPGGFAPPAAISCEPTFGTGVLATERARGAAGSTGLAAGAGAGGVGAGAGEGACGLVVVEGTGRAEGVLAFGAPATLMADEGEGAGTGTPKENEGFDAGAPNDPAVGAGDGVTLAGAAEKLGTASGGAESGELERGAVEVKLRKPPEDLLVVGEGIGGVAGARLEAVCCCAEGEGAKLNDGGFGASAGGGAKLKLGALTGSGALVASGSLTAVGCNGVGDGGAGLRRESKDG